MANPRGKNGFLENEDCCYMELFNAILPTQLVATMTAVKDVAEVSYVDPSLYMHSLIILRNHVANFQPDYVVMTAYPDFFEHLLPFTDFIHMMDTKLITIVNPPGYVEDALDIFHPELAVYSEPEATMRELAEKDFDRSVKGIAYMDGEEIKVNPYRASCFDKVPVADYDLIPDGYWPNYPYAQVQSQRGCPYHCKFCVWGGNIKTDHAPKTRPAHVVAEEVRLLRKKLPPLHAVWILCPQVTHDKKWLEAFAEEKPLERFIKTGARVNEIDLDIIELLKQANIPMVNLGVESFSETVLQRVQKGQTLDQIINGMRLLAENGVGFDVKLMGGIDESAEDMEEANAGVLKAVHAMEGLKKMFSVSTSLCQAYKGTAMWSLGEGKVERWFKYYVNMEAFPGWVVFFNTLMENWRCSHVFNLLNELMKRA